MTEQDIYRLLVWVIFGLAGVTFLYLLRRPAPYGRHFPGYGWGPTVSGRAGWIGMEFPAVFFFLFVYLQGSFKGSLLSLVFLAMWQGHYLNRTLIYPFRMRTGRRMPLVVAGSGFFFNMLNAYVNARFVSHLGEYGATWLIKPCFLIGVAFFAGGVVLNVHSDGILRGLRKQGGTGYVVPDRGAFRYVSCPNYLGEILEWTGWAIATWSLAGLAFCVYTIANLVPRARSNHHWYLERFPDCPPNRRALIPGVF
ncbi:MAG: DUF1295 domain-containing protein [Gemmatimonadota bacterium]|nr:DUF1295 domain-containing protein [Gemmatimonadota bacterium]